MSHMRQALNRLDNPFVKLLLRSPLHGLSSKSVMLLTFTDRKSGRFYSTPVGYSRTGDTLTVITYESRAWWRNLAGGTQVTMCLGGQDVSGSAEVFSDDSEAKEGTLQALSPTMFGRRRVPDEAAEAARGRVVIRIQLTR